MTKQEIKKALISLLIGASVSFLLTLFQGLLGFLQAHAKEIITGVSAGVFFYIKTRQV